MQRYIKIKKININLFLAYIMLGMLGINYLGYAFFRNLEIKNIIRMSIVVLLVYAFLIRSKLSVFDVGLFSISLYLLISDSVISLNVVFLFLIVIISNVWEIDNICKIMNYVNLICLLIILFSLFLGIVENDNWTYLNRNRNTLGFANVNNAGVLTYSIATIYLLSLKEITWKNILLILGFSFGIYKLTDSRTGFFALLLMIFFYYLLISRKKKFEFVIWGIEILCLFSPLFWRSKYINSPIFNRMLSLRPSIFFTYINENTWMNFLFGGSKVREVDNFYIVFLFGTGIIVYLLFSVFLLFSVKSLFIKRAYMKVAFIISMLLMGMTESSIIRPEIMCVTYFWMLVYKEGKCGVNSICGMSTRKKIKY